MGVPQDRFSGLQPVYADTLGRRIVAGDENEGEVLTLVEFDLRTQTPRQCESICVVAFWHWVLADGVTSTAVLTTWHSADGETWTEIDHYTYAKQIDGGGEQGGADLVFACDLNQLRPHVRVTAQVDYTAGDADATTVGALVLLGGMH